MTDAYALCDRELRRRIAQSEVAEKPAGGSLYYFLSAPAPSIPNATLTTLVWNNGPLNSKPSAYKVDTATGIVTFLYAANYFLVVRSTMAANTVGEREVRATLTLPGGGGTRLLAYARISAAQSGYTSHEASGLYPVPAGSTMIAQVKQTSGGALNAINGEGYTNLMIMRMG